MLIAPRRFPMSLGVDAATSERVVWLVQMLGAREVALGLGGWAADRQPGRGRRSWLAAGLLCDAVDAVAIGAAVRRGRVAKAPGLLATAVALGAVAVQARALSQPWPSAVDR